MGNKHSQITLRGVLPAVILLLISGNLHADTPAAPPVLPLFEVIPGNATVVYFHPGPGSDVRAGEVRSAFELGALIADGAQQIGLLSQVDAGTRLWIDALAAMSVVLHYPHAIVLLDISARPREDGGHRLSGLHAALIVDTAGVSESPPQARPGQRIEQRIQHLLNIYTNQEDTTLTTQTRQGGGTGETSRRFELRDRRLPQWATITWGPMRGLYVVAIGDGTFERLLESMHERSRSLAANEWFGMAFDAAGGARLQAGRGLGWYVQFDRLRSAGDRLLTAKINRVLAALRLGRAERALWTVRYKSGTKGRESSASRQRAVEASGVIRRNGEDVFTAVADNRFLSDLGESVIPEEAGSYAIINCNPRSMLEALCQAYLAARSPAARHSSRSFWRGLQERAGVSIDGDIMSRLGRYAVIHDYPRHAFGLPLMWTILTRIDREPDAVRSAIDRLMQVLQRDLADAGLVKLVRGPGGLWYLQFGIEGPALAVTEKWIIISFSPQAVRQNIAVLYPAPPAPPGRAVPTGDESPQRPE